MSENYLHMSTKHLTMDRADQMVADNIQEFLVQFDIEDTPENRVKIITYLQEGLAVYEPFNYDTTDGLNRSTYKIALSLTKMLELVKSF